MRPFFIGPSTALVRGRAVAVDRSALAGTSRRYHLDLTRASRQSARTFACTTRSLLRIEVAARSKRDVGACAVLRIRACASRKRRARCVGICAPVYAAAGVDRKCLRLQDALPDAARAAFYEVGNCMNYGISKHCIHSFNVLASTTPWFQWAKRRRAGRRCVESRGKIFLQKC